ncbi:cation:proton antiporter [Pseudanabaena sp. PCC 6802]|uniref:cation:proton antiporter n=1 Tax=Pseudanabaena sp. PCC 6802 TaxID=118173 RepID=UPI00034C9085|nr:cation:proton antiporter [Pseudanabaena sp. PCC 6802]
MKIAILVLIEVLVVIGLSRLVGLAFRYIKQPLVIGEIVAGIMLGPSLLGLVAPDVAGWLFPPTAIPFLEVLAEVGLIFFMFLIGLELNPKYLKGQLNVAILTSHVSIVVPFSLGTLAALLLYPQLSNGSVSFTAFALFLGSAMSITAFPVLARIITEKNLQNTRIGSLALTCAAVDDVTAWCLLAVAIAVAKTNRMVDAIPTVLLAALYIILMLTVGAKFMQRLAKYYDRTKRLNQFVLAMLFSGVLASALITELIGIHLIFGAFLVGVIMPKDAGFTKEIAIRLEEFILIFMLPVFFAYSGLRTQIGLLNRPELWLLCGLVVAVAIAGKYVGTYVAATFSGINKQDASALGWLMNTRGLTELIVLNIGLDLNVISPLLFTMLVIMALVTTFMTSPLIEAIYQKKPSKVEPLTVAAPHAELSTDISQSAPAYTVLVPVANPSTQQGLVKLALAIAYGQVPITFKDNGEKQYVSVFPLSLLQLEVEYLYESLPEAAEIAIEKRRNHLQESLTNLEPAAAREFIHPIVRVCGDIARTTTQIAETERANLIILGWHHPIFTNNRLGGAVGQILNTATTDTSIFFESRQKDGNGDRFEPIFNNLLVPYAGSIHDFLALEIAIRLLLNHPESNLHILRVSKDSQPSVPPGRSFTQTLELLPSQVSDRIKISLVADKEIDAVVEASSSVDLTIAGVSREWGLERRTFGKYTDRLATRCQSALLVTRKYKLAPSHLVGILQIA